MSKEKMEQIIDEVFINYCQTKIEKTSTGEIWISYAGHYGIISKEEFINKCKTDNEFSQEWGLHIEERELSLRERFRLIGYSEKFYFIVEKAIQEQGEEFLKMKLNEAKIPTKVITLTYQNEKIESYE